MKLFGITIERANKTGLPVETKAAGWMTGDDRGWWPIISEPFTGAWQRNIRHDRQTAIAFHAAFASITQIADDLSQLQPVLQQKRDDGIWEETESPSFSPVLRKPNHYQTRIQFWEHWLLSKLTRGNTYVLKERDGRGIVTAMYVLHPDCCRPLVADDGSVWYEIRADKLSGVPDTVVIPAREIIHDRMHAGLFHPLLGVSPLFAAGLSATQGLEIQAQSVRFFGNNAQPGGLLTADGRIAPADAELMKKQWEENFGGKNFGRIAVLGGGLKFVQLSMSAADAQLIEQHKWAAEIVCGVFKVPGYKVGVGPQPLNNNVQALEVQYLRNCLQKYLESAELCLDDGLGIGDGVGPGRYFRVKFSIDNILRMDGLAQAEFITKLVTGSVFSPDEGRAYFGKPPVPGGESPMAQHQYYSLAALDKRNNSPDPFASGPNVAPEPPPPALPPPAGKGFADADERRDFVDAILRSADRHVLAA